MIRYYEIRTDKISSKSLANMLDSLNDESDMIQEGSFYIVRTVGELKKYPSDFGFKRIMETPYITELFRRAVL